MTTPESGRDPSEMVTLQEVIEALPPARREYIERRARELIAEHCTMCGRLLDVPDDIASENCGGDCCACMADAGDPDCIAALGAGQAEGEG